MTLDEYNGFCASLPAATHVVQWGGSHVWKVGGKMFAVASLSAGGALHVTFKCSAMSYEMLMDRPGLRPAPYLASRGMTWIQHMDDRTLDADALSDYLRASHAMVFAGLPKRLRDSLAGFG